MSATQIRVDGVVLIISLLFASLIILLGVSFYILHNDIEVKLIADVTERLEEEGYQLSVDFEGRDGIIQGYAPDKKTIDDIISIAEKVEGVRTIDNHLTVDTDSAEEATLEGLDNTTADSLENLPSIVDAGIKSNIIPQEELQGITEPVPEVNSIASISGEAENIQDESTLTEMTEKEIIEDIFVPYEIDTTDLTVEQEAVLTKLSAKLLDDPLLFIEMASFHDKPAVAISRTDKIKDFFEEKGIDRDHFDVIWHASSDENKVQLKLFQNN